MMRFSLLFASFLLISPLLAEETIDFGRDIRPILSDQCFVCHGPDEKHRKAKLRMDVKDDVFADRDGVKVIDLDNPEKSELLYRIFSEDPDEVMPPHDSVKQLTDEQKTLLKKWVESGAEWAEHWSFIPPAAEKPNAKIDDFIGARLKKAGLEFSPEASPEVLLRRVTLDLIGLPPTQQERANFLAAVKKDGVDKAYEAVVDRLLKSPHYGERMTLAWMDAARYGDSSVMHADGPRSMWPWRDWVINAYNSNMPFDQFTIEQIAGDMLPEATVAQKVASGFNRNHATSDEGGAIPEELRVEYVVDRVKTTATVWMGLTMECGQCHDHKYDPISQKDYFKFYAYFNNTTDPGMQTRKGNQAPVVEVVDPTRQAKIDEAEAKVKASDEKLAAHRKGADAAFQKWLEGARKKAAGQPKVEEPDGLTHWFPIEGGEKNSVKDAATGIVGQISGKFELSDRPEAGKALKLNGGTTVNFPGFPDREGDEPFTFTGWLKMPANANGAVFAKMDGSKGFRGYDLWLQGGAVGTHIISTWQGNALKVVSAAKLKPNTWQHVAVTYDGSKKAAGVKIYIDGKLTKNNPPEANALKDTIVPDKSIPFKIGGRNNSARVKGEVDDLRIYNQALTAPEILNTKGDPIGGLLTTPDELLTDAQRDLLKNHYLATKDGAYKKLLAEHGKLEKAVADLQQKPATSMVMQDNPANKTRVTYMLDRGHYESPIKDEEIKPGVPSSLPPLPENAEPNRLGLAKWLTTPEHPLTSRVAVNRYWQMFFGEGIVRTVEDFGSQGTPPTHPELLDFLAAEFVESGWDVKRMIKQLVMSKTYRQSSRVSEKIAAADPENELHARGPRFRLQGEFIRDQALAVSGLLNPQIGGPGVKPYQPPNIWNEVSLNGGLRYQQDKGGKLYRRSMYTYWKRSAPMPNMVIFDAPSREKCIMRRPRTNTPLQALVMLNDPQFVEASRLFGERILREGGKSEAERFNFAFELAVSRLPTETEVGVLKDVLQEQRYRFQNAPETAKEFLTIGEKKADEKLDPTELAAWSVLGQMILNLDESLTRG
ncbi:MAG: DUF1553 domain-containing protein [Verrucomicrobiales bacterium]|nr:DUF1553 domain-containing protein [Verrucomicrobiales bacterium]